MRNSVMLKERAQDFIRQSLNLIFGSTMWLCSSLNLFFEGARSPAEMSDKNDSLLVPFGAAFSIWLPIFVLCFIYAVLQALPRNKAEPVYRRLGWWTAAGFGGVCLWGLINAYAPQGALWSAPFDLAQWGTAFIFIPTMLVLVKAMLIATAEESKMTKFERYTIWLGLSLIAGWCSIAVFLNWTPQIVAAFTAAGLSLAIANIIMLGLALIWAVLIIRKSGRNLAYAFPIIWGLAFLILARLIETPQNTVIAGAAAIGILILIGAAQIKPKKRRG